MVMREVSDLAKKMEAFEEWTCKNSQISGQISVNFKPINHIHLIYNVKFQEMKSSILAEVSSGFEKLDKKVEKEVKKDGRNFNKNLIIIFRLLSHRIKICRREIRRRMWKNVTNSPKKTLRTRRKYFLRFYLN